MNPGKLFIFSAASGTGKTSLAQALVESQPDVAFSVSHTTRAPRPGEQNGVHYFFINQQDFDAMVAAGRFLEHATVFGNSYGSSRAVIENLLGQGKNVILDIDWQGAQLVKQQMPQAISIFILPPTRAALEQRLRLRAQDSDEVIARRLRAALSEMSHCREFDYIVVNDDFDAALRDLKAIIRAEGSPRAVTLNIEALLSE